MLCPNFVKHDLSPVINFLPSIKGPCLFEHKGETVISSCLQRANKGTNREECAC